jgi:hypothetical protein
MIIWTLITLLVGIVLGFFLSKPVRSKKTVEGAAKEFKLKRDQRVIQYIELGIPQARAENAVDMELREEARDTLATFQTPCNAVSAGGHFTCVRPKDHKGLCEDSRSIEFNPVTRTLTTRL